MGTKNFGGLDLDELAPGVWGYESRAADLRLFPVVIADEEGSGAVGRWLDSLPEEGIGFPTVVSSRLVGMLTRRGYRPIVHADPDEGDIEIFVQPTDSRVNSRGHAPEPRSR